MKNNDKGTIENIMATRIQSFKSQIDKLFPGMLLLILLLSLPLIVINGQEADIPFTVDRLFDNDDPETAGLAYPENINTVTVFSPRKRDNRYNHGAVLFPFKGMLYIQWQSSSTDEDGSDTRVFYSRSADGMNWSKPVPLTPIWKHGITTSGGWWSHGDSLIAYISVWPDSISPKGGYTEYSASVDGKHWTGFKAVTDINGMPVQGVIEQDIHLSYSGRLITAFHMQPGLHATPYFTDDTYGITGWRAGSMVYLAAKDSAMSRELEPSLFFRRDSAMVMIFRDQNSTYKKLASISHDNGLTWTIPAVIDTPDSRAKQSAGNLPDGTAYMVNNPSGNKNRYPLAITLSRDGYLFDKAFLLRSGGEDLQPLRYPGKYKRTGYSYPKSIVWNGKLYVAYATNKEDIEITIVPVGSLTD